jgi:hypothetical protein
MEQLPEHAQEGEGDKYEGIIERAQEKDEDEAKTWEVRAYTISITIR